METNNNQYSLSKENAFLTLKNFKPASNEDVRNIIETIRNCYVKADVGIEDGHVKIHETNDQASNVKFLIDELNSFIDGIKG